MKSVQVDSALYGSSAYLGDGRWASYARQYSAVRACAPETCLEVGIGNGIVAHAVRAGGIPLVTCDIDPSVSPDHIASVTDLPFPDSSFDCVLCAEVLEHIPFDEVPQALFELYRVTRRHCVVMVPYPAATFSFSFRLPLAARRSFSFRLPLFWRRHSFDGQHYWEMGMKGHSRRSVVRLMHGAGFAALPVPDSFSDPYHALFILEKTCP